MGTVKLERCGLCAGIGSLVQAGDAGGGAGGWRVCASCGGTGVAPAARVEDPEPAPVPAAGLEPALQAAQRLLQEAREERTRRVDAERRLVSEQNATAQLAEQVERLRESVLEEHRRARGALDENATARRLLKAVLWRLDLLGDTGPSSVRLACEALLTGGEKAARKNLEHALPGPPVHIVGERLEPEQEVAIRSRLANAPESVQADVDVVLRELATLRAEHRLGAAYLDALNGGPPSLLSQLVEAERRGMEAAARAMALALVEGTRGMYDDTDGPDDLPTLDALAGLAPALREAVLGATRKIEERTARQLLERIRGLLS